MSIISYAQNYEDVMLWRALSNVKEGIYVDVGAHDPVQDSVTKLFYMNGWRGINIEPVEMWFQRLRDDRAEDVTLQLAAASKLGTIEFYEVEGTGLSTANENYANSHLKSGRVVNKKKVPTKPLDAIFAECGITEIHFLKIDVEGAEQDVLKGLSLQACRPWIIVVEGIDPVTFKKTNSGWEKVLLAKEYQKAYFDGINFFYVAKEHSTLKKHFTVPPNYFDDFVRHSEVLASQKNDQLLGYVEKAENLEAELQNSEARRETLSECTVDLENRLGGVVEAKKEVEEDLIEQRAKNSLMADEIRKLLDIKEKSRGEIEKLQHQLEYIREQYDLAKLGLDSKNAVIEEITQEKTSVEHQLRNVVSELGELNRTKERLEGRLDYAQKRAKMLSDKTNELSSAVDHWWKVADDNLEKRLEIQNSFSWQLALPLRFVEWLVRVFVGYLFVGIKRFYIRPHRRLYRWGLKRVMAFVIGRPGLKKWLKKRASRYPRVSKYFKRKYKRWFRKIPVQATAPGASVNHVSMEKPWDIQQSGLSDFEMKLYKQILIAKSK